jgi:exopolyphosphatase/pppGpp-phosphohydrolase
MSAVVDIGTNSTRLLVADVAGGASPPSSSA